MCGSLLYLNGLSISPRPLLPPVKSVVRILCIQSSPEFPFSSRRIAGTLGA